MDRDTDVPGKRRPHQETECLGVDRGPRAGGTFSCTLVVTKMTSSHTLNTLFALKVFGGSVVVCFHINILIFWLPSHVVCLS